MLKASEDKTFPGAIVASLASPWGQAVSAGDPANTYFGSYREVFARDLYETFTGLVAAGDIATAKDTVRFLFNRQQQPDGSIPRNSLVNGKTAPDSFGIQLDEVAYPILMARTVGLTGQHVLSAAHQEGRRLPRRARAVVRLRAVGGAERLLPVHHLGGDRRAGGSRLDRRAQRRRRRRAGLPRDRGRIPAQHQEVDADDERPAEQQPVLHPAVQDRRPQRGDHLQPRQRRAGRGPAGRHRPGLPGVHAARRSCPPTTPTSPTRSASSTRSIKATTPAAPASTGTARSTPGTEDGYGDCNTGDPTSCTVQGKPWAGVCERRARTRDPGTCGRRCPASAPSRL